MAEHCARLDCCGVTQNVKLGHVAQLCRAHRREVLGVRKQDRPAIADPLVEIDLAQGGFGLEVGGGVVDA